MDILISGLYLFVALVHALPVMGVLSRERLTGLYDVPVENADLSLLLRHRAVLFGIIAALLMAGAFEPALRPVALVTGFVSMLSFVLLASFEPVNPALRRVVRVDVVGSLLLGLAWGLEAIH